MMIVVVTALIGPAESLPLAGPAEPGVSYVCVTDRAAPGWLCHRPPADADPRRAARRVKTAVHDLLPSAEWSIWLDASFDLVASPFEIVAAANGAEIAAFAHPDRSCIHDEGREIIRLGLARSGAVERQVAAYWRAGFPTDAPGILTTTGLMVRRHSDAVARFNRQWWHEMTWHTLRDQLSVDFAAWRTGIEIAHLPGHYRDNPFVRYNRARHRERRTA
jgi:hypothetical protein